MKQLTKRKRPSPVDQSICLAQGNKSPSYKRKICPKTTSAEEMSPFAVLSRKIKAGMTVEAALVLPLFLFFFLNFGSAIEMIRLHGNLELALWDVGKRMSTYAYLLPLKEEMDDSVGEKIMTTVGDLAFSYTYVKSQIVDFLGKDYLSNSPLSKGEDGLQFLGSSILQGDDMVEITIRYQVSPIYPFLGFTPFLMTNHYYAHAWNGFQLPMDSEEQGVVFVAENGSVYHLRRDCTYLALNIVECGSEEVAFCRNEQGRRYTKCQKCTEGKQPECLYITSQGTRYHYKRDCPSLKRTVTTMEIDSAREIYRPCERCGVIEGKT